jgi:hypothetical protein
MMFVMGNAKVRRRWRRRGMPNRQRVEAWGREKEEIGRLFSDEPLISRIILTRPVYSVTLNGVVP